ncbi:MAG: hypothetical protein Q9214_002441 [Letrouitia sp. 1 TL-2023]
MTCTTLTTLTTNPFPCVPSFPSAAVRPRLRVMPESMDAVKSFTYLTDNIPLWLTKIDQLAAEAAQQHARFIRMSQSDFTKIRLSKKKHDSTESLRPPKDDIDDTHNAAPIFVTETPVQPGDTPPSSHPAVNSAAIITKDIRRKRKPASANLSAASGPQKYRTRPMIIVYYDSAIQEAFDSMVRNIAGARNSLRKGRTTATFKARMASIGIGEELPADDPGTFDPQLLVKKVRRDPLANSNTAFDAADKELEEAQNLCEVAAHQFLRDGDCNEEIGGTIQRFKSCLSIAEKEIEKLRAEESKERDDQSRFPELIPHAEEPKAENMPLVSNKMEGPRLPTYSTTNGVIEVDSDSDAGSIQLDLTAFRRMRRV